MDVKKRIGKNKSLILVCLIFIGTMGYGIFWALFDMSRLPTGDYLTEETSPNGKYTLKAYLVNSGATTSYSIRGELVYNHHKNKTKTIYWNSKEDNARLEWVDNNTVVINGHSLHVPKDKYDFRNQ